MRKMTKSISLALSLILLVNLAGLEVSAADNSQQDGAAQEEEVQNGKMDESSDPKAEADVPGEKEKDTSAKEEAGTEKTEAPAKTEEPGQPDKTERAEQPSDALPGDTTDEENAGSVQPSEPSDSHEPVTGNDPVKEEPDKKQEEESNPMNGQASEEEPSEDIPSQEKPVAGTVTGITAKPAGQSGSQLNVSWKSVADAAKYQVRVLKYSNSALVRKADTTDTSLTVKVTKGEKYYIEVSALKEEEKEDIETAIGKIPAILLAKPSVKAKEGTTDIKLSWKSVAGADKYKLVTHEKKTKNVSGTSYEAKKLKNNKKYSFSVQAVCAFKEKDKTYTYTSDIAKISATTKNEKPAQVKKLTGIDGDKSAILTWSKAARAESYIVYRYNASEKKWEVVKKDVKELTYTDKKLAQEKIYKYRVAAYNNGGTGEKSSTVSISVRKTPAKVRSIGYKAVVKSRAPLFTSKSSKKRVRYLKAGTRVTTVDYGKQRYQINLGGKSYWISKDRLRFTSSIWTTSDYSTKTKEDFVNKKGYKSKTKYLIWISHYTQRVIIYQGSKGKWKVIRSGRCATGLHNTMTPKGVYSIISKCKGFFYKYTYEKPGVYFKKGIAFHSRIKKYSGGYSDATIGRPKSHGCVRLMDEEINFIYNKCPKGTTVVSY